MIQRLEWQRQGLGVLGHSKTLKGGAERGRKGLKEEGERKGEYRRKKKEKWKRIIRTGEMV